jgi:DNA-directed RNA polymerase subunit L
MLKLQKIDLKIIEKDLELGNSLLKLNIVGKNINYAVINTLRRVILTDIPIYSFTDFKCSKNTGIVHSNNMKETLANMPVWGVNNTQVIFNESDQETNNIIEEKEVENNEDIDFTNDNISLDKSYKNLTIYLNYKNKTNNIVSVTTDDAKFYYNQKQIKSPYDVPVLLVKLQGYQQITFSAISNLGCERTSAIFNAGFCYFNESETNPNDYEFTIESRGQISEIRILEVCILNILYKIKNFKNLIEENNDINTNLLEGIIMINNEDHTLGNLISKGLQEHEDISFAGYNMPHDLIKIINIHYRLKKKGNIKEIIVDVVDYYDKFYNKLLEQILKLDF